MKGLLIKDYHVVKTSMIILIIFTAIMGIFISSVLPSDIYMVFLPIISYTFSTMLITNTIPSDNISNWNKMSITLPISKGKIVICKYILYFLSIIFGLITGLTIIIVIFLLNKADIKIIYKILHILQASIMIPLLSGSLIIPIVFLTDLGETVVAIVFFICYTIVIFALGRFLPSIQSLSLNTELSYSPILLVITIAFFCLSCYITTLIYRKKVYKK